MEKKDIRNLPLPEIIAGNVISCQVIDKDFVALNVFRDGTLIKRGFVKKDFSTNYTYVLQENKITNALIREAEYYGSYTKYETVGVEVLEKFFEMESITVDRVYSMITAKRHVKKYQKATDYKQYLFSKIKAVPDKDVLKYAKISSRYIIFDRKEKTAFCTSCKSNIDISLVGKNKEQGKCPNCNKKITFISDKLQKNIKDKTTVVGIQAIDENILVARYWNVERTFFDCKPVFNVFETYRMFCDFNQHSVLETTYWNGVWDKVKPFMGFDGYHYPIYEATYMPYKRELRKAKLDKIFDGVPFAKPVITVECLCLKPFVEKLYKGGLTNLAMTFFNNTYYYYRKEQLYGKTEETLKGIVKAKDKAQLKEMVEQNITVDDLEWIQQYNLDCAISRSVKEILEYKGFYYSRRKFFYTLSKKNAKKIKEYCEENKVSVADYVDYFKACEKLGYIMNDFTRFPKDFITAHDEATGKVKEEENKELYEKAEMTFEKAHENFDYSDENFSIFAPTKALDIVREGQKMHHCVGGYIDKVAEGICTILFVRNNQELDKPLVTVEVRDGKIIQARAFANAAPSEEVRAFLDDFRREKLMMAV